MKEVWKQIKAHEVLLEVEINANTLILLSLFWL